MEISAINGLLLVFSSGAYLKLLVQVTSLVKINSSAEGSLCFLAL